MIKYIAISSLVDRENLTEQFFVEEGKSEVIQTPLILDSARPVNNAL